MGNCKYAMCGRGRKKNNGTYSFHRFPKNPELLKKWVDALNLENYIAKASDFVCSTHFQPTSFYTHNGRKHLLPNSKPIKCLPTSTVTPHSLTFTSSISNVTTTHLTEFNASNSSCCNHYQPETICEIPKESVPIPSTSSCLLPTVHEINVQHDHSYCGSPRKTKQKLMLERKRHMLTKKKLKYNKQKLKRLTCNIKCLKDVIKDLKTNILISHNTSDLLDAGFPDVSQSIFSRITMNKGSKLSRKKYPTDIRAFALTVQFYSTKAYNYLRNSFHKSLPHPATLRSWYNQVDGKPGFTSESFTALNNIVRKYQMENLSNDPILCSLMLDEMHIMTDKQWDGTSYSGHIDMGTNLNDSDDLPLASEALVFMVVALKFHWKLPIGYFFIKGIAPRRGYN